MTIGVKSNGAESEANLDLSSYNVATESDTYREDTSTVDGGSGGTNSCDEAEELFAASLNKEMSALQQSTSMLAKTYKDLQEKRYQLQQIMGPDLHSKPEKLESSHATADKPKYKAPRGPTDKRGNAGNENRNPMNSEARAALQLPRDTQRTPLQAPRHTRDWSSSQSSNWRNDSWKDGSWRNDSYDSSSKQGWHSGSSTEGQWQKPYGAPSPDNGLSEVSSKVANCFGIDNVAQMIVSQSSTPEGNLTQQYNIVVQLHRNPGVASPLQHLEHFLGENLERETVVHLECARDDSHLSLVHMHMTDQTCWDHIKKGACPRQSYCRWEHPAPTRYVFSLTWADVPQASYLAMPTDGQFMRTEACSGVMMVCSSGNFGAIPEQYDGEQIQAALNAAQPEYYED
jgi:hypothetical protein